MTKSTHAKAASEIRKILKREFPKTKFKVISQSYSMGSSVDVYWFDGPTKDAVQSLISQFQYGHFDGMTDMYEYSNSRDDIPQVKYVCTNRRMSDEVREEIEANLPENISLYQKDKIIYNEFKDLSL